MKVILAGLIGQSGTGGQAWAYAQYMISLIELGHEVLYLEDCGEESWVYNWETREFTMDVEYPIAYIARCLGALGLGNRWIFRAGDTTAGIPLADFRDFCSKAELLIIRAMPFSVWREEYDWPSRRAFIDVDPGFTQLSVVNGNRVLIDTLEHCDRLFTIAQRIGASDCQVPTGGYSWSPTLPPVALSQWRSVFDDSARYFTSVMRLGGIQDEHPSSADLGEKNRTFLEFLQLPRLVSQEFSVACVGGDPGLLSKNGWRVSPGEIVTSTPNSYRDFIHESRAEFGVAKHGYVQSRAGWFSDRSVCYLASGKPVLLQDTGLGDWLPTGKGLVVFRDLAGAVEGVESINGNYSLHCQAARRLAEQVFDGKAIVRRLLEVAME